MAIGKYQKGLNAKRNIRIAKMYFEGMSQKKIARFMGMSFSNVHRIIFEMGGKDGIAQRFGKEIIADRVEGFVRVDEDDLLRAGLRTTTDKSARRVIKAALGLPDQNEIRNLRLGEKIKLIVKIRKVIGNHIAR